MTKQVIKRPGSLSFRKLYWTENGNHGLARIAQANLNGSDISTLFGNVERPAGLGIEYNSREDR